MQRTGPDTATLSGPSDSGRGPVLVPLDGSILAERALPWGTQLASLRRAPLLLVRAVPPTPPVIAPGPATFSLIEEILEEEWEAAAAYIQEKASEIRLAVPGLEVRTAVSFGDPATALLEQEAGADVQLVVMSTHGRSGLQRWIRGSIAEAVLRRGTVPVVLIRPSDDPVDSVQTIRRTRDDRGLRILVPLDGSALAAEAVPEACRLAVDGSGELVLTMVVPPATLPWARSPALNVSTPPAVPGVARRRDTAQPYLVSIARGLCRRGLRVTTVVLTADDPAPAIVDLATLEEIDLVVMATHGRGGLGRWRYGSVADAVSHTAPAPVMLVRPVTRARREVVPAPATIGRLVDRPDALTRSPL